MEYNVALERNALYLCGWGLEWSQLNAEKASHCTRYGMSLLVFQKIRPVSVCAYSQVYNA